MFLKDKLKKIKFLVQGYRKTCQIISDIIWTPYLFLRIKFSKQRPVFFEGCVYTIGYRMKKVNWGDDIDKFFFEYVTKLPFIFVPFRKLSKKYHVLHYSLIGSIIGFYDLNNTIIYGSGIKDPSVKIFGKPKKVVSVRGPLTRKVLLSNGISCPEEYGDPALLLPVFYKPKRRKRHKVAIIPNMGTDIKYVKRWLSAQNKFDYTIIKMESYSDWRRKIDEIVSCDIVISESLHGLIVAETYGVTNVWVEFMDHPEYWDFKYLDYYSSINKNEEKYQLQKGITLKEIYKSAQKWKKADIDYNSMLKVFPFEIRCSKREKMIKKI